ncbi:MAG: TIGR02757 family protein [Ignavibacteriales bacterium]|nr:TIGR02757 family protein [Ignavibacteriales bacterium]
MKQKLDALYKRYNTIADITDPVHFPHSCTDDTDKEIAAFIAAIFAYGSVSQIRNSLVKISNVFGGHPVDFLTTSTEDSLRDSVEGIYHRFYSEEDVSNLFISLKNVLEQHGSLQNLFKHGLVKNNLRQAITLFNDRMLIDASSRLGKTSNGLRFMFPDARKGSACKRMNLFLRWMVRKDNVDFGIWDCLAPSELIIPVDTHIAQVARLLKFTQRKPQDWQMAEEITAELRKFDVNDPVKYDFALCHIGIEKKTNQLFLE